MSNVFGLQKNGSNNVFALQTGPTTPGTTSLAASVSPPTVAIGSSVAVSINFGSVISGNVSANIATLAGMAMMQAQASPNTVAPTNPSGSQWTAKPKTHTVWTTV